MTEDEELDAAVDEDFEAFVADAAGPATRLAAVHGWDYVWNLMRDVVQDWDERRDA